MAVLRADLVFSYWIYVWFIIYAMNYTTYSPKFALILGLIYNIVMLFLMIYYRTNKKTIFFFILINTIIKIIPLYYLRNNTLKWKDIFFTILLFIIFIIWLHMNKQSLIGNMKLIHDSLLYNKNNTPFMSLVEKIEKNIKNIQLF